MSKATMIREKETFRTEQIINIEGEDVKFYVKSSVNYERLTYKVQPVITMIHSLGDDVNKAIISSVGQAVTECRNRLAKYREEVGIGNQGDLFGQAQADSE